MFGVNQPQGSLMDMLQKFDQFKRSMNGQDPQTVVQQLLNSGKMSREQFDQLSQMANQLQGLLGMK